MNFRQADISEDITAQMLAFDAVLVPEDVPEALVQDEGGAYWLQIKAQRAAQVQLEINTDLYDFNRGEDGIWRLRLPLTGGLHYVHLLIDGTLWLSPYLPISYGYSRPCNTIALPEEDGDFYRLRDVPHGKLVRDYFYSSVTQRWVSCMVYTPPAYEEETEKIFPVLYLQHGHGENECGWSASGKVPFILDNLIAEGKCTPFAVVMNNGMVQRAAEGKRIVDFTLFDRCLREDIIPFAEKRYRVGRTKDRRAMAGLSMGSLQTAIAGFRHPELFDSLGIFSGFLYDWIQGSELDMVDRGPGDNGHLAFLEDRDKVEKAFRVFFRAIGDKDPFFEYFKEDDLRCERSGIRQERRIYDGIHDWNVWRRCIRDFSQLIFRP